MTQAIRTTLLAAQAILAAGIFASASGPATAQPAAELRQAFDVRVPHPPMPFRAAGRTRLVYELMLANVSRGPLELRRVEALDAASGRVLAMLEPPPLPAATATLGGVEAARGTVEAGRVAIVYIDADLAPGATIPDSVRHRITFGQRDGTGIVTGGETRVAAAPLPRLGPPLRGGPWAAVYDPGLANGHRRYLYATDGRAVIPGRHAIDWMAAGLQPGDGLGAEVLAVADGVVVAARDGMPEPDPAGPRLLPTLAEAAGNFIALDIGGGRTAFYEHLAPGLAVRIGDRVVRGQPIARLGSTGQASRAHLHFHLAGGLAPLGAEGLPYVLEGARIVGAYRDVAVASRGGAWTRTAERSLDSGGDNLPPPNSVVRFD